MPTRPKSRYIPAGGYEDTELRQLGYSYVGRTVWCFYRDNGLACLPGSYWAPGWLNDLHLYLGDTLASRPHRRLFVQELLRILYVASWCDPKVLEILWRLGGPVALLTFLEEPLRRASCDWRYNLERHAFIGDLVLATSHGSGAGYRTDYDQPTCHRPYRHHPAIAKPIQRGESVSCT